MGRHGENIRKRADGRWEARLITGYDSNGRAKYRYLYGKTYLEAKKKKQNASVQIQATAREPIHENVQLGQAAREWLSRQKPCVKESTYAHYVNLVEKHILPALGESCLERFDTDLIECYFKDKLSNGRIDGTGGLSAKTVADIRSVLAQILDYAVQKGYMNISVKLPAVQVRTPQINVLPPHEQKMLEEVIFEEDSPLCLGILTALYAGLRIGEVCALQWGDFDMTEGTVHVRRTVIRIQDTAPDAPAKTKVILQEPKTRCSIRTIPVPEFLRAYLYERQLPANCFLLTGAAQYMEPRSCLKKYKQLLHRAGLGDYTFHTLRHTFATRCVENAFDIKSLSEIMGHSNVSVTMQRYVHPSMDLKRQQMNRLERL